MNRKLISSLLITSICLTAACDSTAETSIPESSASLTSTVAETSTPPETSAATETSITETDPFEVTHEYTPFASGNGYSLIDAGFGTDVTDQQGGTCWAHAAATSLESNFLLAQGISIDIDPMDIVEGTYGSVAHPDPDREGFHPRMYSASNVGAGPIQTVTGLICGIDGGIVLTEAWNYAGLSREELQEAIRTNGAFTAAYLDRNTDYHEFDGFTTLNNMEDDADHAATVVGWDDDFPAEYFDPPASQNGAWLIQNSFSDRWGNDGCFWLSYDTEFAEPVGYEGSTGYSHVCSYGSCTNYIETGEQTVLANVFEHEGSLSAIGTFTFEPDQTVTVDIYNGSSTDGELLISKSENFAYPGYHTIELYYVDVSTFTVVVTYNGRAPVEGESTEAFYDDSYIAYIASIEPGQSYVLMDGEWVDLSDGNISELLGIGFTPNNASINALFM